MSTLTKILIILLTISSLFLCGYVVQYVSSVDNYKKLYNDTEGKLRQTQQELAEKTKNLDDETKKRYQIEDTKNNQIASLNNKISELENDIANLEREYAKQKAENDSLVSTTQYLANQSEKNKESLLATQAKLDNTITKLDAEKWNLEETSNLLLEKESLIDMLEVDLKRLTEEKIALENKLNRILQPYGKKSVTERPITPEKDLAQISTVAITEKIGLKGLVTGVEMKNSMAKISLGKSDGVKNGMRFHVSRGNEYICDIVIIDVASEEAVGMLELIQQQPKIGDNISTNW